MSTISSVGSAGSAWSDLSSTRASARKDRMFAKADANGDGTVDKTELQSMLDDISSKTGDSLGNADDLMSKMDADGSGSLSKDELADGMKSLMPPPASTMDFAQQRSADGSSGSTAAADDLFGQLDADSSGGLNATELNKLLDQIAAGQSTTDSTTATSSTDSTAAAANAAVFKTLDADGDGTISKSEFAAAVSGQGEGRDHGHMPPPPPPTDASSSSSSGTSTTSTDPLDTNGDGVVSAAELAAGQFKELMTNLSSALDGSGTGSLSSSQGDALKSQFDSMIAALESAGSSGASSDSTSTGSDSSSSSSSNQGNGLDLSALANLVMKEYTQAASNYAQTSSVSLAA